MRANLDIVQQWLAMSEGGYVNHPKDPGGATNMGVTQRVYSHWLTGRGMADRSVIGITKHEAERIFKDQYYTPVRFDDLPSGLDYAMADYSVNSGPMRAAKDLQRVLRDLGHDIAVDGHIGAGTMAALAKEPDTAVVINSLVNRRWAFMRSLRHFSSFQNGWRRRLFGTEKGIQDWDTGVLDRATRMASGKAIASTPKQHHTAKAPDSTQTLLSVILGKMKGMLSK